MDFLTQKEVSGFKQDVKHGEAKQMVDKLSFKKKLLGEFGDSIQETIEHPEKTNNNVKFAKEYRKRKKIAIWKENIKKIFGGTKKETI